MPVREIRPEERADFERLESIAFASPLSEEDLRRRLEREPEAVCLGHFDSAGTLTAGMVLPEYQMRYEDRFVPMVGVGGVASLPEYRYQGAIRRVFEAAFARMREGGAVFSALYPFSHPYYRQFGYELCQLTARYTLPVDALRSFRCEATVRRIEPGDPFDGLQAVYDAHFARCNMAIRREARHWQGLVTKEPLRERVYTYLLQDAQGPCAYVVFAAQNVGEYSKEMRVREIAFAHPKGLRDALGFLYRLAPQYGKAILTLPDGVPLHAVLPESYDASADIFSHPMARVVDLPRALALKPHPAGAAYTLRVHDAMIPGNDGLFAVQCEAAGVSVRRLEADAPADLEAGVQQITQLLLGFLSLDEALYSPQVTLRASGDVLRRIFVKRPVYLTEFF